MSDLSRAAFEAFWQREFGKGFAETFSRDSTGEGYQSGVVQRDWKVWQVCAAASPEHSAEPAAWRPIETAPKDGTALLVMRDIWPGTGHPRTNVEALSYPSPQPRKFSQ